MNPKIQHIAADFVQAAGYITAAASIPGIGTLSPYIGLGAGLLGLIASWAKTNVVGNIPPSLTPLASAPTTTVVTPTK
jgi:tetrahydromethanopterin S-methyltransferase subunit D